jgi:uncharacterized membrane protein
MGNPQDPYGQQPYQPQQPYQQPPQQPYQQPYGGAPVPPPPAPSAGSQWGPSSIGLDANVAAGLGYLIPIIGLIFFFIEKTNRFVRFHGAQSIMLVIAYVIVFAIQIFVGIIGAVADNAVNGTGLIFTLLGCLVGLLYLAVFALQIWGIIAGFTGKYVKFPIVGDIAERLAGGPAGPAM